MAGEVVKITGLDGFLATLKKLPEELVSRRGGVVLSGLRKGGNVMKKAWKGQIQRIIDQPNIGGVYYSKGILAKNIRAFRMRRPESVGGNEALRVTINSKATYPDGTRVALVAGVLENGTEHMEAKAPMTKAFMSHKEKALLAVVKGSNDALQKAIDKLESQNRR